MRLPEGFVVISEAAPATPFERRVHRVVKRIPAGTVASYGRIAEWAGRPGGRSDPVVAGSSYSACS